MGGCGSRDKELREKLGLPQQDFDYAIKKFNKMSAIKPGKEGQYIASEGFKIKFPENLGLATKLYRFYRQQGQQNYIDLATFLTTSDLFIRQSMKLQSQPHRNLDILHLFALVSLINADSFNPQTAYKCTVTFSNAAKLFKELINMQSSKKEILCADDDQAPLLLINNIFQNQSQLDFQTFITRLKEEIVQANKIIKCYFASKFMNKSLRIQIPKIPIDSLIMNRQLIALFNLSVPWFHKCLNMELIYKYELGADYNFNQMANQLLKAKQPTLILFRHTSRIDAKIQYVFGYFSATQWRLSPDISGNKSSFIFSLTPKFKLFSTNHSQGQSKYSLLIPIITKKSSQQLSGVGGPKTPGLGLGGSGYEQHRIWIDGKQLQNSWVKEEDKTFEPGQLLAQDLHMLNIDLIEVWQLQLTNVGQSTSYFKSTQFNNHLTDHNSNKRVSQNALREVMVTLNHDVARRNNRETTKEFIQLSIPELPEEDDGKQ